MKQLIRLNGFKIEPEAGQHHSMLLETFTNESKSSLNTDCAHCILHQL